MTDPNEFELDDLDSPFWDCDEDNEAYDDEPGTFHQYVYDRLPDNDSDGLQLCDDCGDVEVRAPLRFCSSCSRQRQIDND